ncbi:MAG: protein kinase [Planctomycetota bacterium]|jgi:serine/threonine protein kinase|nr:protein kinase [Planctomycetota bacterium]
MSTTRHERWNDSTHDDLYGSGEAGVDNDFIGQMVAGYRIDSFLGIGGNAQVYLAASPDTGREVAIKIFGRADDRASYARFMREAEVVVGIRHPNVVSCFGIGEIDGRAYMLLEMMAGGDLEEYVERFGGRLDMERALRVAIDCAKGLQEVHNSGYVHRDIKPGNIFMDHEGVAKVGDLGLAHRLATETQSDVNQRAAGTPAYMSPEQARGDRGIDVRSDIYSLGATLFYLLTGRPPYAGKSSYDVVDRILNEPPPDPKMFAMGIADEVADVINVCLYKEREFRYTSVQELLADLTSLLGSKIPTRAYHRREHRNEVTRKRDAISLRSVTWRRFRVHILLSLFLAVFLVCSVLIIAWPRGGAEIDPLDGRPTPPPVPTASPESVREITAFQGLAFTSWDTRGAVRVSESGVAVDGGVLEWRDTSELNRRLATGGDFSVEFDLSLSDLTQTGPARVVGLSAGSASRNFSLCQNGSSWELRLRTTRTSPNGLRPHLATLTGTVLVGRQHLVFVRVGDNHLLYVDGAEVGRERVPGDCSNWDPAFPLVIGDEVDGRFPWRGTVHGVRFYEGALDAVKVLGAYRNWIQASAGGSRP